MPITCIMFELKQLGVKSKIKEGQSISSEEEGMSINANGKMKLLSHQIIHWRQRKNMFMNI